jgi:hypothetical protein
MNSDQMTRHSTDQILWLLRSWFHAHLDTDRPIHAWTRVNRYVRTEGDCLDSFGVEELIDDIQNSTGHEIPREQWDELFASWKITFGQLADFIASRVPGISFADITILGRSCPTAGVFRGIEATARLTKPGIARFAPSTPIQWRLRGSSLQQFWWRLHWMSQGTIPGLNASLSERVLYCLLGVAVIATLGTELLEWTGAHHSALVAPIWIAALAIMSAIVVCPILSIIQRLSGIETRLPADIRTFGDLARSWRNQNAGRPSGGLPDLPRSS